MQRRLLYFLPVVLVITLHQAHASSVLCSMQTAMSGPFVAQNCNQALTTPNASLSWGEILPATSGLTPGPLTASVGGTSFAVTSNALFEGLDNTALAWNGSQWVPAFLTSSAATYAGHFNSTTTPNGPPPEGPLGDQLLGAVALPGTVNANTTITLTFAMTLSFVEFQVSSIQGTNSDFTAELIAFDTNGHILGTYQVTDMGGGGLCPGLANSAGPQPCNDAPFVQFYDPGDHIASVELIMNDSAGALIDTLDVQNPIPEPSSVALFTLGAVLVAWKIRRHKAAVV